MIRPISAALILIVCCFVGGLSAWPATPPYVYGPITGPVFLPAPVAGPGNLQAGKPGDIELTLEGSVRMAIQGATAVLKSEYDNRTSGAQLLQAYGQFLPNLSSTGNYGYASGLTYSTAGNPAYVTGSGTNAAYSISSALNLFNGLSDFSNLKSALLKKDAANLTVYRAKQQIRLDVTQSYLQAVLDHTLVNIADQNLRASLERERLFTEQTRVGVRSLSDLFRQQAQTSTDELSLITQRNKLLTDQLLLLGKLRLESIKGYRFVEPQLLKEHDVPPLKEEKILIETALARRVDLKAFGELAIADHWDVRTAWGGYLPKLDLVAALSSSGHYLDSQTVNGGSAVPPTQNNISYQLGDHLQYSIGLNLTWTIYDRFTTHQTLSRLQTVADDADLDAQDRKIQVESDVRKAYADYVTAVQQLRVANRGLVAAQKAYEVLAARYGVGGVSLLDLLTGQTVLVQAESAHAQALVAFQLQETSLSFATGELAVQ